MDSGFYISAFVTLFVIIDPIGLAPLFAALTLGMQQKRRRAIAMRAALIAFSLLILFTFLGEAVMRFVGISMPAFRIAGGALLFLTALEMLFERRTQRRQEQTDTSEAQEDDGHDPSVFPLATPLIAGPGSIATVILLAGQDPGMIGAARVAAIAGAVLILVFIMFLTAGLIERLLGKTGINVVTRLLGMLLAALSVQFILDGLRAFGLGG